MTNPASPRTVSLTKAICGITVPFLRSAFLASLPVPPDCHSPLTPRPQTWEDPHQVHRDICKPGDNDPLDACEIGRAIAQVGDVKQVKVLGVLGLVDNGEADWKVLVIDIHDPLADQVNDLDDVNKHFPGLLDASRDWFRIYGLPDGEGKGEFAFGGVWRGPR